MAGSLGRLPGGRGWRAALLLVLPAPPPGHCPPPPPPPQWRQWAPLPHLCLQHCELEGSREGLKQHRKYTGVFCTYTAVKVLTQVSVLPPRGYWVRNAKSDTTRLDYYTPLGFSLPYLGCWKVEGLLRSQGCSCGRQEAKHGSCSLFPQSCPTCPKVPM